jgi:hypothetical protein
MKKILQYSWIIALVVLAAFTGCRGGGNDDTPEGDVFQGSWVWFSFDDDDDGGNSDSTLTEGEDGVITISGTVRPGFDYPFAGWGADPEDAETLAKLQAARFITFNIRGMPSGTYRIMMKTSDISDHSYFGDSFFVGSRETPVRVSVALFAQPVEWGEDRKDSLNRSAITGLQWQLSGGPAAEIPFQIFMSDLLLEE